VTGPESQLYWRNFSDHKSRPRYLGKGRLRSGKQDHGSKGKGAGAASRPLDRQPWPHSAYELETTASRDNGKYERDDDTARGAAAVAGVAVVATPAVKEHASET
jgi:hypothetical protein